MRVNNFNILRLMFAILVILSHSFELIDGNRLREPLIRLYGTMTFGEISVDGFFLLSGYLISKSWGAKPSLFVFFKNRILRIYPGYVVCSLLCLFLIAPLGADLNTYFNSIEYAKVFLNLLTFTGPITPSFLFDKPDRPINGSLWSIAPEFRCYIYVAIFGVLNLSKKYSWWLAITMILCIIFFSMQYVNYYKLHPSIFGRLPLNNFGNYLSVRLAFCFFVGGLYHFYAGEITFKREYLFFSVIILAAMLNSSMMAEISFVVFGGYIVFYFANFKFKYSEAIQKIPDVSFGVYLYAWPIQIYLIWKLNITSGVWLFLMSTLLSLLVGWVSWIFVEKPFLKFKQISGKSI